jgi:hypothetical protein
MKQDPKLWHIPLGMVLALVALVLLMCGCKEVEMVTVPEVHEIHHHHTDSVIQRDSVIKESLTTVMQLDSAEMAKYGIQLKAAERAWLVRTKELEREIERIMAMRTDSVAKRDSIPYPVYVPKEVPAELTWWQRTRIYMGDALLVIILLLIGIGVMRLTKILRF